MKLRKIVCCALSAVMIFSALPCVSLGAEAESVENGLLAHYDFETDAALPSVIKDISGNGNDASVINNGSRITVEGGTVSFPGCVNTGVCSLGAALKLPKDFNQGVKDFTFSAWIKADSSYAYASSGNMSRIFDFGNIDGGDTYNSIFARYTVASGLMRIQDRGGSMGTSSMYKESYLSEKPFNDKWGLLTVEFEYNAASSSYKVSTYINGVLNESLSSASSLFKRSLDDLGVLTDSTNGLFIGRTVWSNTTLLQTNPDFCGQMDDIRIYSRALSAEEIEYLYDSTSPTEAEPEIVEYKVNGVYTTVGKAPALPAEVEAVYSNGTTGSRSVTWEEVDPSLYAQEGVFTVKGTVTEDKASVEVSVTVKKAVNDEQLSEGLILYYTFNNDISEPDVITDISGCGNDGSVFNTKASISGATIENKLKVEDGTAVFPGRTSFNGQAVQGAAIKLPCGVNTGIENFTYSAWIYADTSYMYASNLQRFFDFGRETDTNMNSIFLRYTVSNGNMRFQDRFIGSSIDDNRSLVSSVLTDKPFNDKWALLTVVYEKEGEYYIPRIYINGEKRDEFNSSSAMLTRSLGDLGMLTDSTNGLWIGRTQWKDSYNPDFCGKMDEIRLYSRALSDEEVLRLYMTTSPSEEQTGDTLISVDFVDGSGNLICKEEAYANSGDEFTYNVERKLIEWNGEVYAFSEEESSLSIDSAEQGSKITVVYKKAEEISAREAQVVTSVGSSVNLPKNVTVEADGYKAQLAAQWEYVSTFEEKGIYTVSGTIAGTDKAISAKVSVFPNCSGEVGGDITINIYADGVLQKSVVPTVMYGDTYRLPESYKNYLGDGYIFEGVGGDIADFEESIIADKLYQVIEIYFTSSEELHTALSAQIKADDLAGTSYSLRIKADILNMEKEDRTIILAVAAYDSDGTMTSVETERVTVKARSGVHTVIEKKKAYTEEDNSKVIYLWSENLLPLSEPIRVKELTKEGMLSDEAEVMLPTAESAQSALKSANGYWQSRTKAEDMSYTWDAAVYHTGNIEAYKLLNEEDYLQYSTDWANAQNWSTPNYIDEFFGDNQTCFQTYIDLYNLGISSASLDKVLDVMGRQIETSSDSYWYWADALYMVMPVMTKLYNLTGEEKHLDRLYDWFRYAKELMYDGEGGIPESASGYTTSARLNYGAQYSDPGDYKNLFYRDANYVYPLRPNTGHEEEKNFWSRGNGWVFAALAKVLGDVPEDWEHYGEFYKTYVEMAAAIKGCQETDENGYGFWTQSLLQDYPKGQNGNDEGYETSGTAFFTYGLFWGINNGILAEEEYLETAARAWGYLENVALQKSGMVGYVQHVGSQATVATSRDSTLNFGVGAFLLASCEAARWSDKN